MVWGVIKIKKRTARLKKCHFCGFSESGLLFISKDRMFNLPGRFRVVKCLNCGLVFLNPPPNKKTILKHYPKDKYYSYQKTEKESFLGRLRKHLIFKYYGSKKFSNFEDPGFLIKTLASLIRKVPAIPKFKPGGRLLDIGCGSGKSLALFKKLGWEVFGIETDKNAVNFARERGLKNVILGSFEKIKDYPDSFFDVIRLYHVLEHLPDPSFCLKLIHKKLKRGGKVIVGVPNLDSFAGKLFGKYWYNLDSPRHLFVFSRKTLNKLLRKTSFKVIKEEYCSGGGILGSIQYIINGKLKTKIDLINRTYLFILFYPLEWFLDRAKFGDVITLTAKK